jgi:hypothetical protein
VKATNEAVLVPVEDPLLVVVVAFVEVVAAKSLSDWHLLLEDI